MVARENVEAKADEDADEERATEGAAEGAAWEAAEGNGGPKAAKDAEREGTVEGRPKMRHGRPQTGARRQLTTPKGTRWPREGPRTPKGTKRPRNGRKGGALARRSVGRWGRRGNAHLMGGGVCVCDERLN